MAVRQYGLERGRATFVTAVLLGALDAVLASGVATPGEQSTKTLQETYLAMVVVACSRAMGTP